jgi:hypothetical protein
MMRDEDAKPIPDDDFRKERRYLAPHVFAWPGGQEPAEIPAPFDLIAKDVWEGIMDLPTDVVLKTSSFEGSVTSSMAETKRDWTMGLPEPGTAPFMEEPALLAGEEFDSLVFIAMHGWYRQALACLRNALETMMGAAALAATNDRATFERWRSGEVEVPFRVARSKLRDSALGRQVESDASPQSVFGDRGSWTKARYARLCAYAHSQPGFNNADFWQSNGPLMVPPALYLAEAELRETAALCYLLLRLGSSNDISPEGPRKLLATPTGNWFVYESVLRRWLIPGD